MVPLNLPDVISLDLPATCQDSGSWTCAAVYHWTGNADLAHASAWVIGKPLALLWLVVIGLVARWLVVKLIDRVVSRAIGGVVPGKIARGPLGGLADPVAETGVHRRTQRARTMGSLLKSIASSLIFVVVLMMAISELGYDIAPLIASAGILGVALGFGAQSLVKDFLSGIFMIFEDQLGVGDVVDLGDASGTVEAVGLRVTRLRDVNGTVWYVRNGEILRVGNQSQNWARSVLDISVGYGEDLNRVRRVLTDVAHDLWLDPDFNQIVIEEPEVWGVESLDADGIVVRVALKTVPLQQWRVSRVMRERIKARFDAEGIEIPFPQRVVWNREDPSGSPEASPAGAEAGAPADEHAEDDR